MHNNGYRPDGGDLEKNSVPTGKTAVNGKPQDKPNGKALSVNGKPPPSEEEDDPWKVTEFSANYTPWEELNKKRKFMRVCGYIIRVSLVFGCLYMFVCSLDFLSKAFKLLGGEAAGKVFQQNEIMKNPLTGLMMGVLVTVLIQSSSTTTSIVVSMVGAGILSIEQSVPIIMGSNIGTSVTNTIVALGSVRDEGEFRRAFAGATVHDMFNWLQVLVFLPIEAASGFLYHLTKAVVDSLPIETNTETKKDYLKKITKPFTEKIVQVSKDAIAMISKDQKAELETDHVILKLCCDKTPPLKCCKSKVSDWKTEFEGLRANTTIRENFCGEINSCVAGLDTTPANCPTLPWTYEKSRFDNRDTLDCNTFSNILTEQTCCVDVFENRNFFESDSTEIVTESERKSLCKDSDLSSCFKDTSSTFSYDTCMLGGSWFKTNTTVTGHDTFDCVDWVVESAKKPCNSECDHLFKGMYPTLNDKEIGAILLVIAFMILCGCLFGIVKLLQSLLQGPVAKVIKKVVNADMPGPLGYFTGYFAILIGAALTIIVQSSSVFTSSLTPLVGIGVIEIERMYPLTLGANIGTTTTAILAALANSGQKLKDSLQAAFCHLFLNVFGICIFYPLPFFRPPIRLSKFLGNKTAKYRWFAIVYIIFLFFLVPSIILGLSLAGWIVLAAILLPIAFLLIVIAFIKLIQAKRPQWLPKKLQDWKFLPLWLRSLAPYDSVMKKIFFCARFERKEDTDEVAFGDINKPVNDDAHVTHNTRI